MRAHDALDANAYRMNRRSLIKRAGLLGMALPVAGSLLQACGSESDDISPATMERGSNVPGTDALASTGNTAPAAQSGETTELTITAVDLSFKPTEVSVPANQPVRVTFINEGAIEHDWDVHGITAEGVSVVEQPTTFNDRMQGLLNEAKRNGRPYAGAMSGDRMVIEFTPRSPGTFDMFCMVPGHKEAGMKGTFTVTGGDGTAATASDGHDHSHAVMTSASTGTPYDAERLPNPTVPTRLALGSREPSPRRSRSVR